MVAMVPQGHVACHCYAAGSCRLYVAGTQPSSVGYKSQSRRSPAPATCGYPRPGGIGSSIMVI